MKNKLQILKWRRRADVLARTTLPCLAPYHTLNLTAGCPNECVYCYARSYAHNPGRGRVAFYANMLERLREEYGGLREKPTMVYFSTAGDPFLPVEEILDDMFEIMAFLLDRDVSLLISTKCVVPQRFVDLFGRFPGKACVQVGVTTKDDGIRRLLEPRASTVEERLYSLHRLNAEGVAAEARMDPLIPGLTDTIDSLCTIFPELARVGVRNAAASYLFLRWGIRVPGNLTWNGWSFAEMRKMYTHKVTGYCGGGTIWLPPAQYRRERYSTLKTMAEAHGVTVRLCRCKNPELTGECCHPRPRIRSKGP